MVEIYGMIPCFTRGEVGKGLLREDICKSLVLFQDGASRWAGSLGLSLLCQPQGVKVAQMHSSHSGVRRIAYTASPGSSSSSRFSTHPLQPVGQWVIKTFWAVQSTSRLWCNSQGCPMITDCCPRLVTTNCALSKCHLKHRRAGTSSVMELCSLVEPSTLCNRTGWGSGVVSSQCFCTKSQLMNILVALEVRVVSSTWRLREGVGGLHEDIGLSRRGCRWSHTV